MIFDTKHKSAWEYINDEWAEIFEGEGNVLDSSNEIYDNLIYQDSMLFVRAIPDGTEEKARIYAIDTKNKQVRLLNIQGVVQPASYKDNQIFALQGFPY